MKYKCIKPYQWYDACIAEKGDIITINSNSITNITRSTTYDTDYLPMENLKKCLEAIVDDPQTPPVYTDADRFETITRKMHNIFKKKNHDYGNSFEQSLNEEGLAASRIRMGDKWNRYKTLSRPKVDVQVNDESIRDTLLDLANYAIMTVIWLDKQNGNV